MKYSRQRELICEAVQTALDHPTAEAVYLHLLREHPSLSLATVYRNLGQLCEAGRLRRIRVPDGSDRFDGVLSEHSHLICDVCGGIANIRCGTAAISEAMQKETGCSIRSVELIVHGICRACKEISNDPQYDITEVTP